MGWPEAGLPAWTLLTESGKFLPGQSKTAISEAQIGQLRAVRSTLMLIETPACALSVSPLPMRTALNVGPNLGPSEFLPGTQSGFWRDI